MFPSADTSFYRHVILFVVCRRLFFTRCAAPFAYGSRSRLSDPAFDRHIVFFTTLFGVRLKVPIGSVCRLSRNDMVKLMSFGIE
ncbi:hypothetical protein M3J09_002121 [Ascochyta lentis]